MPPSMRVAVAPNSMWKAEFLSYLHATSDITYGMHMRRELPHFEV